MAHNNNAWKVYNIIVYLNVMLYYSIYIESEHLQRSNVID